MEEEEEGLELRAARRISARLARAAARRNSTGSQVAVAELIGVIRESICPIADDFICTVQDAKFQIIPKIMLLLFAAFLPAVLSLSFLLVAIPAPGHILPLIGIAKVSCFSLNRYLLRFISSPLYFQSLSARGHCVSIATGQHLEQLVKNHIPPSVRFLSLGDHSSYRNSSCFVTAAQVDSLLEGLFCSNINIPKRLTFSHPFQEAWPSNNGSTSSIPPCSLL